MKWLKKVLGFETPVKPLIIQNAKPAKISENDIPKAEAAQRGRWMLEHYVTTAERSVARAQIALADAAAIELRR